MQPEPWPDRVDDSDYEQTAAYHDNCDLLARYQDAGEGRLKIDLCIHGEYTTTPKVVEAVAKHAAQAGTHVHVHLSETQSEHEECKARHGMTPAAYFEKLGLFDQPTTAAHLRLAGRQRFYHPQTPWRDCGLVPGQ